jgi:serine/threonine-protein kinase
MDQYIGKMLNDRYEILDVLGVGGMAVVYKAKCHRLNRMVAVKILKPEMAEDREIRNRFHAEAQAVGMMSHPNIVNIYDVNQDGDTDYFVMELIEGITLKQYMTKRGGALNWREALHFSVQIMQALGHAHSKGIIHRDIKPQNIMVLRDGSVKVADFGIARIMDAQKTMTQEALGSVHYISPEQASGKDIDARCDIYSAGVVLYEMLTGRLPYEGDSPVAVAIQHINSMALAPRELNPDIPVGMEQITMKAMARDRDQRYESAEAMLADLDAFRKNPNIVFDYDSGWMPSSDAVAGAASTVIPFVPAQEELPSEEADQEDEDDEDEEDEEEEEGSNHTMAIIIGVIVAILLVILLIFRMLWGTFFAGVLDTGETYTVPKLQGMTYSEAEKTIFTDEALNGHFTVTVSETTIYDAHYEIGEIVSQEPEAGTTTKSQSTEIVVVLCGEPEEEGTELIMPDILNDDYSKWADKLREEYGVTVKYNPQYSDEVEEGMIISTDPKAGTKLTAGQSVTLNYSKGAKVTTTTMISLIGMTENEAKSAIQELGLSPGTVTTVSSDETAGTVVYQSVKTNSEVELGSRVDIQISSGPKPEDPPEPEEPDQEEPVTTTQPDETDEPEQPDDLPEDETHTITVTLPEGRTEDASITIRVNGVNYHSKTVKTNEKEVSVQYKGTVESVDVILDGVQLGNDCYTVS